MSLLKRAKAKSEKQTKDEDKSHDSGFYYILFFVFILIFLPMYILLAMWILGQYSSTIGLSAILIIGVIALIFSLALMALLFKRFDLADKNQTLGLPEGSVRAIIALSLILIFMMSSIFIYSQIQSSGAKEYNFNGITQEQINNISKTGEIVSITRLNSTNENNQTLFNVIQVVSTTNTSATDIAKQIITTVSTLVVAVAGFYFGSKAGAGGKVGKEEEEISSPVISSIELGSYSIPTEKNKEDVSITINGKNFNSPKVELRSKSGESIECVDPLSNKTTIEGKVTIKNNTPEGKWTVVVTNSDKGEHILKDVIALSKSVKPPEPAKPQ